MGDLISREAALDAIKRSAHNIHPFAVENISDACKRVGEIPSFTAPSNDVVAKIEALRDELEAQYDAALDHDALLEFRSRRDSVEDVLAILRQGEKS